MPAIALTSLIFMCPQNLAHSNRGTRTLSRTSRKSYLDGRCTDFGLRKIVRLTNPFFLTGFAISSRRSSNGTHLSHSHQRVSQLLLHPRKRYLLVFLYISVLRSHNALVNVDPLILLRLASSSNSPCLCGAGTDHNYLVIPYGNGAFHVYRTHAV